MKHFINCMLIASVLGSSCSRAGGETAATAVEPGTSDETEKTLSPNDPSTMNQDLPKVELPKISYDKSKLPNILILDQMLTDAHTVATAAKQFDEQFRAVKDASQASMDGSNENRLRTVLQIADAYKKFESQGVPIAKKATELVTAKYGSDGGFEARYRDTYYALEENDLKTIADKVTYRTVWAEVSDLYKNAGRMNSSFMGSSLSEFEELKRSTVSSVLGSARVNLMVAEYQNGKALADLLMGTQSVLDAVKSTNPGADDVAKIAEMKATIDATRKKREGEIKKAREECRFPARYAGGNAPANAAELETRLKSFLGKFMYDGKNLYDIKKVTVAGPWIEVRSPLGVLLYYQIDFYVANKYKGMNAGVTSVDFVTAKTSGPDTKSAFGSYSIGGFAEMLDVNLK